MITDIAALPGLTALWLADLKRDDPTIYNEIADDIRVADAKGHWPGGHFGSGHRHVDTVLARFDLVGKRIGAFEMPPPTAATPLEALSNYNAARKREFETDADLMFVGSYSSALVVSMDNQIGIMDLTQDTVALDFLAPSFDRFIVTQANAYDAFKRHLVDDDNEDAYWTECKTCLEHPAFEGTDVERIFFLQLKG